MESASYASLPPKLEPPKEEKFEPPPWQNFQIPVEIKEDKEEEEKVESQEDKFEPIRRRRLSQRRRSLSHPRRRSLSHNKRLLSHPRRRHLMRLSHPNRRRRRFSHQELSGCGDSRTRHCMVKMEIIGHVLVHL